MSASILDLHSASGIIDVSDDDLVAAVAEVLSVPRVGVPNSFVLHAPLELVARARLLPIVAPSEREEARQRIREIADKYESFGPGIGSGHLDQTREPAGGAYDSARDRASALLEAVLSGDLDETDRKAVALVSGDVPGGVSVAEILEVLVPGLAASTAAAGHAPILFRFLFELGDRAGPFLALLRPVALALALDPEWRMRWFDVDRERCSQPAETDSRALGAVLSSTYGLLEPESTSIHPQMMEAEQSGVARRLLGPVLGGNNEASAVEVCRVAALSMIYDTAERAHFGWTHCLTMPYALLSLRRYEAWDGQMLAIAATEVLAFRGAQGTVELGGHDAMLTGVDDDEYGRRRAGLVAEAAVSDDAHFVKYVENVLVAARWDREAADLYLCAGERLCELLS